MRLIVLILAAIATAYGVLQIDKIDPDNYVKIYLGNYVVELKVVSFLLLLLVVVIVLCCLVWLLKSILRCPESITRWRNRRNRNLADEQFGAGYLSLIKGDWSRAEKQLTTKPDHSHIPYVNYLVAATAAQELGRVEQRDAYLSAAYAAAPKERLAIALTKAKLHERDGRIEAAIATLEDVGEPGRNNPQYTAMLMQAYHRNNDWQAVQRLLPLARKQHALPESVILGLQNDIYNHNLRCSSDTQATWKALPRNQRKRPENVLIYARSLVNRGESSAAERLIRGALNDHWSDELVDIYGQLQSAKPEKLLRRVDHWLMARPENAHLNLAAGRLAQATQSLDAAKQYLQLAITQGPLAAAYLVLGEVYEADKQSVKAMQLYRAGIRALANQPQQSTRAPVILDEKNGVDWLAANNSKPPMEAPVVAERHATR